jgi:uncharacterized membrane protein HdeD (DUF308 family)
MSFFQRFKSILSGILMLLFVVLLLLLPDKAYYLVAGVLGLLLTIYGLRLLWYYLTMARHMVGGKTILYQSVIVIDFGLLGSTLMSVSSAMVIFYLLGIYAFTGGISVLRAFEAKKYGGAWKLKLITGIIGLGLAVALVVLGFAFGLTQYLVYGFCLSIAYSAVVRIVSAFRPTAMVYIQ